MSKLPRNLLAVYTAHGLNGLLGAVAVPIALKLLGIEGYGLLSIYTLMVSYILLADFGVGKNLLRLLAENREPGNQVRQIRTALGLYIWLCLAWLALCPIIAYAAPRYLFPVPPAAVAALRSIVILSIAEFILGVPASLMQTACVAAQRFESYARFSAISSLIRNAAILIGAWAFGSPEVIAVLLASRKVVEVFVARRLLGSLPAGSWIPLFDRQGLRAMLGQSAALSLSQISYSSVMSIGSLLVNASFGLYGLGLYRAAQDLAGKITFVANGATLVVFPRAARYFSSTAITEPRPSGSVRHVSVSEPRPSGSVRPEPEPKQPLPNGRGSVSNGRGSVSGAALFSDLVLCSVGAYACFAAVAVAAARFVLPAIGLENETIVRLFMVLVVGLSINAHSLLANELIQASGRYRYNLYFSLSTLGTLVLLFFAVKPFAGLMSIGWAWIGAALVSACVADGLLLKLVAARQGQHIASIAVKVLATAACAVLAASQFGLFADAAAAVSALAIGALLVSAVPRAASLIRAWSGPSGIAEPAVQPVCS